MCLDELGNICSAQRIKVVTSGEKISNLIPVKTIYLAKVTRLDFQEQLYLTRSTSVAKGSTVNGSRK